MQAATPNLFKDNLVLRAALIAPVAMMFMFSFFNLSAVPDMQRAMSGLSIGIVDADEGMGPLRLSERLLGGLGDGLGFSTVPQESEAAGRAALDAGDVAALILVPPEFSRNAATGAEVHLTVLASEHRSTLETQFGAGLGRQLEAGVGAGLTGAMAQMGQAAPPVSVETEIVHKAPNQVALAAPAVASFALWAAGLSGGAALFLGTEPMRRRLGAGKTGLLRAVLPAVAGGLATLLLALTIAWFSGLWGAFLGLWLVLWLAAYAVSVLMGGLFALMGLWALPVVLPLVFYQGTLSGVQAPLAASPDWLRWLGEAIPFGALPQGMRAVLIGGPDGGIVPVALAAAGIGVALIFAGTYLWSSMNKDAQTGTHG